jgi:hypothetical protein
MVNLIFDYNLVLGTQRKEFAESVRSGNIVIENRIRANFL